MDNQKISFSFSRFVKQESFGGVLLILMAIVAVAWANSDTLGWLYQELFNREDALNIALTVENYHPHLHNLHYWINDGLMAIFFFTIGLEIKREVFAGELQSIKQSMLPIVGAIGGMLFPAIIYLTINANNPENFSGWGVPMATDIAFAIGVMALLGKRVPIAAKVFLTALAIADDLGAILVIAIAYTKGLDLSWLLVAFFFTIILIVANSKNVRAIWFYVIVGLAGVWFPFLMSGVHATIAGVVVAFTVPANTLIKEKEYVKQISKAIENFACTKPSCTCMLENEQTSILHRIRLINNKVQSPVQQLEHTLTPYVNYLILPLFALANAGVVIDTSISVAIVNPISLGVIFGLIFGKMFGISIFAWLAIKLNIASMPSNTTWGQMIGVALLGGIGFTMAIFIAELAYTTDEQMQVAKLGIFTASILSALGGYLLLSFFKRKKA